jgi:hypothetical protein
LTLCVSLFTTPDASILAELVTEVLRPLRSKMSANIAAMMTLREILDGIIISYTSFCLEGDKRAPGDNYLSPAGI